VIVEIIHSKLWKLFVLKNPKALIGSQIFEEDLFFLDKIPRMNSCTFVPIEKDSLSSIGHKTSTPMFKG